MIVASGDFDGNAQRDATGLYGRDKKFFSFINEIADSIKVRPVQAKLTSDLLA